MLFKRGAVMMALNMLLGDKRKQWEAAGFKREHEEEWSRILCNRIMNICSIVAEAQRRNPTVDWLAQMLWNCKAGEDAREPAAGSTWVVTWSRELRLAQRYLSSNPDKKEWSKPPEQDDDAGDGDPLVCVWPDGWKHEVPEMTYAK